MDQQKNNTKKLFEGFPPITTEKWEEQIFTDLKGEDYFKKLVWQSPDGIDVKPYYRSEQLKEIEYLELAPGEYPFVRGNFKPSWKTRQEITVLKIDQANAEALDAIKNGADYICFRMSQVPPPEILEKLLDGIDLKKTYIGFSNSDCFRELIEKYCSYLDAKGIDHKDVHGSFEIDPLANLMINGELMDSYMTILLKLYGIVDHVFKDLPDYKALSIRGYYYHNAGATTVQEIAYTLAAANEYFAQLTKSGHNIDDLSQHLQLTLGTGSNYFIEIAKIRATRMLYAQMVEQYQPQEEASLQVTINSINSAWNKSIYDPYTNILRATTEAMSAICGGTDALTIEPFDIHFKEPDEFSKRIARNIQNLLRQESALDKSLDPGAGSYYIENLTDSLASEAWKLFQEIEKRGGFYEAAVQGFLQDELDKTVEKRKQMLASGKDKILGANMYPDLNELISPDVQKPPNNERKTAGKMVRPIHIYRKAEEFEKLRLRTENFVLKGGKKPAAFLLKIGKPGMSTLRAIFSGNFFATAGFEIINNDRFLNAAEGISEAIKSKAEIVVVCSADDDYAKYAPEVAEGIKNSKNKTMVIVAGWPKDMVEELKLKGVDDFIHVKCNLLETLENYQKKLAIG